MNNLTDVADDKSVTKLNLMNVNETFITAPSHKQIKMQADIL